MVGMFGRLVDSIMRFSLIVRGKVPGGFAAAAHVRYQEAGQLPPTYYVRAVRDAGYLVLQYWFFYAMNDWRSTSAESTIMRPTGSRSLFSSPSPLMAVTRT